MSSTAHSFAHPQIDTILEVPSRVYPHPGRYRVRLFHGPAVPVLLLTDLGAKNPGASVTNAAAEIVALVCARFGLTASNLSVVEHYDRRRPAGAMSSRRAADAEAFTEIVSGLTGLTQANAWCAALQWRPVEKKRLESQLGAALP